MSSPAAKSPYAGYRFPAEVISHAVWLYFRFPLSLRMVEVERRAAELGLSAGDLFAQTARQETTGQGTRRRRPRSDAGAKRAVAVRYRGPGGEEWSGRGRTPRWLVAQEAEGRNREEFAVDPELRLLSC